MNQPKAGCGAPRPGTVLIDKTAVRQVEWAERISSSVRAEFDRVASALRQTAERQAQDSRYQASQAERRAQRTVASTCPLNN